MPNFLFEVPDKDGTVVRLDEGRWLVHIAEKHPEVQSFVSEIKSVIHYPTIITRDSGGSFHLSTLGAVGGPWRKLYLEVVVRYRQVSENKIGDVLTVYFTTAPPKGELIWLQPKPRRA